LPGLASRFLLEACRNEGELNASFIQVSLISIYRILKAKKKKLFKSSSPNPLQQERA